MCTPQGIIEKLGCLAFDEAVKAAIKAGKYVHHYTINLKNLQDETRKLKDCSERIEEKVREANSRGEQVNNDVTHWRTDVDTMTHDVQELVGQSGGTGNVSCLACSFPNIKQRYRLSKQAEEKIAGVQKLTQDSHFREIAHRKPPPPELEFPSNENYVNLDSRTPVFEKIGNALNDPSVNVIGVHGLGGVGKTTLVEAVGKKKRHDGTFKQVALAVVSTDLNVKKIQSQLADSLDFKWDPPSDDQKGRATQLWHKFTNGEKYLVILDDIWEKVDFKTIGIPITDGKTGCKVLLTSRNEDLLVNRMNVNKAFQIAILPEPDAWTLFKKLTGNLIDETLASKVCNKCNGLPVAINALGAALKDKPDHAWKDALDKLERYMIMNIEGINPSVWASLKLSYDMLSPNAKSCFLLCCLYPDDAEISINNLARHCLITRSFLSPNPRTLEEARRAVCTLVDSLKSASLLSTGNEENAVRIHDVIRDVGISIARQEKRFLVDHGADRWPRNPIHGDHYSAISLRTEKIKWLPDELICPQLHTLMFVNSEFSDLEVPDNFFSGMKQLTVLILSQMRFRRLPSSLAKLESLEMLCLEDCELEDISILGNLKTSLQVLSLQGSTIEALPQEIEKLTNLLSLDLRGCENLAVIPQGVISNLTSLEELYLDDFCQWQATEHKRQDTSISNVTLEELRGLLSTGQLTTLHMNVPDVELLPKESLNFENLKTFRIKVGFADSLADWRFKRLQGTRVLIHVGSSLRNEFIPLVDKAESLFLKNVKGLKKLLQDRGVGNRFLDLKYIEVISCDDYMEYLIGHGLHPSKSFNNLIEVIIERCKLKYLFSPSSARRLLHLKKLTVEFCEIMEEIIGFEGQNDEDELPSAVTFSKLNELVLTNLPNLISFNAKKEKTRTTTGSSSARAQPLFNEKVILPVLERLTISKVGNIVEIWDQKSIAAIKDKGSFRQLTDVTVSDCNKLLLVFPCKIHPLLKNLKELIVEGCDAMEGIVEFEGEIDEDGLRNEICFSKLYRLELTSLPNMVSFCTKLGTPATTDSNATIHAQPLFNEKVILPVLERLTISEVGNIVEIWDQKSIAAIKDKGSFRQLTDVTVSDCNKLLLVFPCKIHPLLKNLKELIVEGCDAMEGIVEFEGEIDEDGLRNEICFSKLYSLELKSLPNMVSLCTKLGTPATTDSNATIHAQPLFNEKVILPVLERLTISEVGNIVEIWDQKSIAAIKDKGSFRQLTDVTVSDCNKLLLVFPCKIHPLLKNLKELIVEGCDAMEGIVEFEGEIDEDGLRNEICFSKLYSLELKSLPNMVSLCTKLGTPATTDSNATIHAQPLFNEKVILPVLERLTISEVGNIVEIWDQKSIAAIKDKGSFRQLTDVTVSDCNKLLLVFPCKIHPLLKNLKELIVEGCDAMEGIVEFEGEIDEDGLRNEICFSKLYSLELKSLPNMVSLCTKLGTPATTDSNATIHAQPLFNEKVILPVLERLTISKVGNIEEIWDKKSIAAIKNKGSFRQLTDVTVSDCNELLLVFPCKIHPLLKNLKELIVKGCAAMEGIVDFEGERDEDGLRNEICFSKLYRLELNVLPNMVSFCTKLGTPATTDSNATIHAQPLFNEKVIFPVLENLYIRRLDNIVKIWDKQSIAIFEEQGSFCELTNVTVRICKKLMHVFPSNMHPLLKNLQSLEVRGCGTMKAIAEFEGEVDEDGLRNEVASPALEHLEMVGAPKITEIRDKHPLPESRKEVESLCKLRRIEIEDCNQLMYVFLSNMLPRNLEILYIGTCDELEVIFSKDLKEEEAINNDIIVFSQLKDVTLVTLPKLKSFYTETQGLFSHKVAFPALEYLDFWKLDKITWIWDNQPLSKSEKEAKSFCELSSISISDCVHLEYVLPFYMLPQLENLQDLEIRGCTKMEAIISNNPKEKEATNNDTILLPQLNSVDLGNLPNLKCLCTKTQLFFSNKDAFPALEEIELSEGLEFLRDGTSTNEECGTSGKSALE